MALDEKEFRRMLDRSAEIAEARRQRIQTSGERRRSLLTKAIQTNRVEAKYEPVDENYNPRQRFESELGRILRRGSDGENEDQGSN